MKDGFRVYDTDTHIDPAPTCWRNMSIRAFRPRLAELAPYRVAVKSRSARRRRCATPTASTSSAYERTLGRGRAAPGSADGRVWRGKRRPQPRRRRRPLRQPRPRHGCGGRRTCISWCRRCGPASSACPTCRSKSALIRAYHRHMHEFCGAVSGPAQGADRRLDPRCRRGRARDPRMGQFEMGGRGAAAARQRPAGRPPRPRTDLAGRRGARSGDRASQLHLVAALFPRLPRHVGQCLPGAAVLAPVGRDAVHGRVSRRRHPRPPSGLAALRPRMRLRLAAVLGAPHGRAGQLCRPHRQAEACCRASISPPAACSATSRRTSTSRCSRW